MDRNQELRKAAEDRAGQVPPEVRGYLCHIYRNKIHVVRGLMELVRMRIGPGEQSDRLLAASDVIDDLTNQLKPFIGEVGK